MVSRWGAALAALLLLTLAAPAEARQHHPGRGHRIVPVGAPLDTFTAPSGAYSFRKLRTAYAGAAVRLRRASDNAELDIGFTVSGDFNTSAAVAHCAATTCHGRWWYDQSGAARDIGQATVANQPQLIFGCTGSLPCWRLTSNVQSMQSAGTMTPVAPVSLNIVAARTVGTTTGCFFRTSGAASNTLGFRAAAAGLNLSGSGGTPITNSAAEGAWHTATGVVNGASSSLAFDGGAATSGNVTTAVAAGITGLFGAASITCDWGEIVAWSAYGITVPETAALSNNQKDYWAPLPLDTFASPSGAYSFRKLKSSYSGPAVRIRRASDNAEVDINFLGFTSFTGAPWDEAAAVAHCAATTCTVVTWYDQSGNARHLTSLTSPADTAPALVLNCVNSTGCLEMTVSNTQGLAAASFTPATGTWSMSAVANRVSGTGACMWWRENGAVNRLVSSATPGQWALLPGPTLAGAAADNQWHAAAGVESLTPGVSVLNIDGVETTANPTPTTAAGPIGVFGAAATNCRAVEVAFWDNYQLTAAERTALVNNLRSFWGF